MKGVVLNLLEEAVSAEYGEDTWEDLLDAAGVNGVYTSLGSYDDSELMRLVEAASRALDLPADDVVRWFGRAAIPLFAQQYAELFADHTNTRSFLLTLNEIIHPEVRKLYPGADVPEFEFDTSTDQALLMGYHSARGLCMFGEGLIEGAATHFGDTVGVRQTSCTRLGDDRCVFEVTFAP